MLRLSLAYILLLSAVVVTPLSARLHAQQAGHNAYVSRHFDLAITYATEDTKQANTVQHVWLQGGSVEIGANIYHGLGIAADFTGLHAHSIGSSGLPFSEITMTFGPRYRISVNNRISLYGQVLVGEGDAFDSIFPGSGGAQSGTNSLAVKGGGGVDYRLTERFAVRALEASWIHTQYPNSTNSRQNDLRMGVGLVLLFGR